MSQNNYFEVLAASPQWDDRQIAVHVRSYDKVDPNTKQDALRKLLNPQERLLSELTTFHDPDYTAPITEGDRDGSFLTCLAETPDNAVNLSPHLTFYLYRRVTAHPEFINIPSSFQQILQDIRADVWVLHSLALIYERCADHCKETGKTDQMMKMVEKSVSCWVEIFNRGSFLQETYTWRKFAGTSKEELCLQVWNNITGRTPESSYEQFKEQLNMSRVKPACVYLNLVKRLTSFGELGIVANAVLDKMISDLIKEADAIFFRGKVKTGYTGDYEGVFSYLHDLYGGVGNLERLLLYEAGKEDSYMFELRTTKSYEISYYHVPAIKDLEKRLNSVKPESSQPFNIENEIKNLYDRLQDLAIDSINDGRYRLATALMRTLTGDRKIKVGNEYKTLNEMIYLCEQMAVQTGDYWSPHGAPTPLKPVYTPPPPSGGYRPAPQPAARNIKGNIGCLIWVIVIVITLVLFIRSCNNGKSKESSNNETAVTTTQAVPTHTAKATDAQEKPAPTSKPSKPTQGKSAAAPAIPINEDTTLSVFYEAYNQLKADNIKTFLNEAKKVSPHLSFEEITTDIELPQRLTVMHATDSMPDIVFANQKTIINGITQESFESMFIDITGLNCFSGVYQPIADSVTIDGKKYGIPMEAYTFGILYNKDVFERMGLAAPETTEELEAVCDVFNANGIHPFANNFYEKYLNRYIVLDTELASCLYEHPELYADMAVKGLKPSSYPVIRECIDRYVQKIQYSANDPENCSFDDSFAWIADGTAAMMIVYNAGLSDILKSNPSADIGFIANPVSDTENAIFVDTETTVLAGVQSKHKEACISFLQYAASEEGQLAYNKNSVYAVPVREIGRTDFHPVVKDIIGYLEQNRHFYEDLNQNGINSYPGVMYEISKIEDIGDLNVENLLRLLDSEERGN